ncbi:MAG: trimethylamine methyltransferase family protein [Desulfobacterales bacterium]|nr:MAG: trimethylamine methyltransferase family protein [Desulfobacterales bacterium]
MIQTNSTEKQRPFFRMLTEDQVHELIRAAFEVMERVGFKVLHPDARNMLKKAGAIVAEDRVKVPEFIVRQCLHTAPKGWTIYNREGQRSLEVENRKSYYGTSTASPNTKDALTGEVHPTTVADLALAAKVADYLPHIDWVMPMGSCQNVPATAAELHEFVATVANTVKPIVFLTYSSRATELVFEMAAEVAGGLERLQEKPFVVLYPESISPLVFPAEVVARMFVAADLGLPQMMGPAIQPGATGPVTMAGAVAQGLAESLMGVVLVQLRRPGSPVGLGCNFGIFDMGTGLMGVAAPEMSLALAAQAEVAQYFGLPTWGLAGSTEAKVLDAQAGAEAAFHIMAQGLAGLNLIHDVGYMDMGMVCAVEQLILGNEIIGMTKRFLRGMELNPQNLARELIASVGPGGNFLDSEHTLQHFQHELWRPGIFTRQQYQRWQETGAKDTATRVREEIQRILETHRPPALGDKILANLEEIKKRGEKELA